MHGTNEAARAAVVEARPKSDGRLVKKVTEARTIAHWPTGMLGALDVPIAFRPSSPEVGS